MSNAYRDENNVPTLIAVSNVDGQTPVPLYADPVTHRLLTNATSSGSGITSINADTTAAQTIVTASTGTDFTITTSGGVTTVAIPSASATARGLITTGTQIIAGQKDFTGNIGIGLSTAPNARLEVDTVVTNNTTVNAAYFVNAASGDNAGTSILLGYAASSGNTGGISAYFNNASGGIITALGSQGVNALFVDKNSRVGIGAQSVPNTTLDIKNVSGADTLVTITKSATQASSNANLLSLDGGSITMRTGGYIYAAQFGDNNSHITLNTSGLNIDNATTVNFGVSAGSGDVAIARNAAGVIEVNSNTIGTFRDLKLRSLLVAGSSSGTTTVSASATASGTLTLPAATDTLVGKATTDTLTNKTLTTPTITKPVMNATNPTAQTYSPSAAGTATLDLSLSNQHDITMPAGNITIALSNDTNNQLFYVSILQDGTGSRTVTWFTTIRWAGGSAPTLTTTASKRDAFIFKRTGSGTYDGFIVGQNI